MAKCEWVYLGRILVLCNGVLLCDEWRVWCQHYTGWDTVSIYHLIHSALSCSQIRTSISPSLLIWEYSSLILYKNQSIFFLFMFLQKNHSHITMTQSSNDSRTDFLEDLVPASRWPVVAQTNSRRGSNNTKCGNISARLLSRLPLGQRRRNIVSDWPKGGAAPQRVGHSPLLIPILVIWYFSE